MKRIVTLLALLLAFVLMLAATVTPRNIPWNVTDHVVGDDHPWGGEQDDEDPTTQSAFAGDGPFFSTGLTALDLFFNSIIIKYDFRLWDNGSRGTGTIVGTIDDSTSDSDSGQPVSTTSNQGN